MGDYLVKYIYSMGSHDYEKILQEVSVVKLALHDLEGKVEDIERDIKNEMDMKLQKTEWEHKEYDRRISLTEKVVFGAVGIILVTFMGAILTTILK